MRFRPTVAEALMPGSSPMRLSLAMGRILREMTVVRWTPDLHCVRHRSENSDVRARRVVRTRPLAVREVMLRAGLRLWHKPIQWWHGQPQDDEHLSAPANEGVAGPGSGLRAVRLGQRVHSSPGASGAGGLQPRVNR